MNDMPEPDEKPPESREKPRELMMLLSLSTDRLIAVLVIVASILLGVWMFRH